MEDPTFFNQSAFLYALYYQVQITVHRQWIPSPKKTSALSFASLAICTNAARSSIHILEVQHERYPHSSYHFIVRACDFPSFTSVLILLCRGLFISKLQLFSIGIVLIINIWGGKRSGMSTNPAKEMQDVYKCMRILKYLEPRCA